MSQELAEGVQHALAKLDSREAYVLRVRYDIGTGDDHTLADLGRELGVSRERVRQIEAAALEHLRNSTQAAMLKEFLDGAVVCERTSRSTQGGRAEDVSGAQVQAPPHTGTARENHVDGRKDSWLTL